MMYRKYLVIRDCMSGCRKRKHIILRRGLEIELDADADPRVQKWIAKGKLKEINANVLHDNQAVTPDNDQ
jgi:hypothetical protein